MCFMSFVVSCKGMLRFLNACTDVRRASYVGCGGDDEIEFPSFCSKGLGEWLIICQLFP